MSHPIWVQNTVECLRIQPGERFQALVDEPLADVGLALCRGAIDAGAQAWVTVIPDVARPLTDAAGPFLAALGETEAGVMWLSVTHPGEFESFRMPIYRRLAETGTRFAYGPNIDDDILAIEMSADYGEMRKRGAAFRAAVEGAAMIRVTTPNGTDCTFEIGDRSWHVDDGYVDPGHFTNLPAGEVYISPLESGANGVCVVDRSIAVHGLGLLEEPIRLHFEHGRIVAVEGGSEADAVRSAIEAAGEGADVVAELGIGTNEKARITGLVITDEKVLGTAHVAFGDNTGQYGGVNHASIHVDGIMADATIEADGRVVIDRGQLVS